MITISYCKTLEPTEWSSFLLCVGVFPPHVFVQEVFPVYCIRRMGRQMWVTVLLLYPGQLSWRTKAFLWMFFFLFVFLVMGDSLFFGWSFNSGLDSLGGYFTWSFETLHTPCCSASKHNALQSCDVMSGEVWYADNRKKGMWKGILGNTIQ